MPTRLNQICRELHTLKGASGSVGLVGSGQTNCTSWKIVFAMTSGRPIAEHRFVAEERRFDPLSRSR